MRGNNRLTQKLTSPTLFNLQSLQIKWQWLCRACFNLNWIFKFKLNVCKSYAWHVLPEKVSMIANRGWFGYVGSCATSSDPCALTWGLFWNLGYTWSSFTLRPENDPKKMFWALVRVQRKRMNSPLIQNMVIVQWSFEDWFFRWAS